MERRQPKWMLQRRIESRSLTIECAGLKGLVLHGSNPQEIVIRAHANSVIEINMMLLLYLYLNSGNFHF